MTIDDIDKPPRPKAEAPDVSRPRLGPGAPPLPPAKGRDETWAAFTYRLRTYHRALGNWKPTHGWSLHDRVNFLVEVDGAIGWAEKQKDPTP